MLDLKKWSDDNDPHSLSNRMRAKRFNLFEDLASRCPRPLKIIDIGGTSAFWENRGWTDREGVHITLVNLQEENTGRDCIVSRVGDATNLIEFGENEFDIAFSNSVIEHLFTYKNQVAMAREVLRVAKAHFLQTPNYWFPIEPHFQLPAWQWMPESLRSAVLTRRQCGHRGPYGSKEEALQSIREVRLMTRGELRRLFPGSTIWSEKFYGLTKSFVVYGGFPG
jgi:hypothetical protein